MRKSAGCGVLFGFFLGLSWAHANEYVVRFRNAQTFRHYTQVQGIGITNSIPQLNVVVLKSDNIAELKNYYSDVQYVYESKPVHIYASTQFSSEVNGLWGMMAINVLQAWTRTKGAGVIVAVSDTGVTTSHIDLSSRMRANPGETGIDVNGKDRSKNKLDDDQNGYVDDKYGWDFVANAPATLDNHYHGTHVAGTIAAIENNGGVVGTAPDAKIMSSAFLDSAGSGTDVNGAKSIIYAADNGAKIINCSWGGEGTAPVIFDAIAYAQQKGVLVVAAAGNDGTNTDQSPHSPSAENLDNIISVGATFSSNGGKASFSNYGILTVDIAAPGDQIRSTGNYLKRFDQMYMFLSGTSMAAPHVSGVAALVWSARPDFTWRQVKDIILSSAKVVKSWTGKSATGGILQADKAVELALSK